MSPLEVSVLLDYSSMKSQLSTMVTGIGKQFQQLEGLGLNFSKMSTESFKTMNWMPILSKLFAPANLIAMFSAMAALGITASLSQQQAATTAVTSTSATSTASDVAATAAAGQQVTDVIGTLAGSQSDVDDMIDRLEEYGMSTQDATTLTTQLGESLKLTGGQFSSTFNTDFIEYLQSTGATTADQIALVTSNLQAASQASNGLLSMSSIVQNTKDFAQAAQGAGTNLTGILDSVVRYGGESAINFQAAQGNMQVLTTTMEGTNSTVAGLIGFPKQMADSLNKDTNAAWNAMEGTIEKVVSNQMPGYTASMVGFNTQAALGEGILQKQQDKVDGLISKYAILNGDSGIAGTNKQFEGTLSDMDKFQIMVSQLENGFASIVVTTKSWSDNIANSIASLGSSVGKDLLNTWNTLHSTSEVSSLTSGNTPSTSSSASSTNNKTANVTQNITVNNSNTGTGTSGALENALKGVMSWL